MADEMTIERNVRAVQAAADKLHTDQGAEFTIVLMMKGGKIYSGAWVPSEEIFKLILQRALKTMDDGSADIRDLRGKT